MRAKLLQKIKGEHKVPLENLNTRIICSLFLDFLKTENFKYTPSVFVPECGHAQKFLSPSEVAEALDIPLPGEPLLHHIISSYQKAQRRPHLYESASQTEDFSIISNLEEKLSKLDLEYIRKTKSDSDPHTMEERMLRYQRECDQRMQKELSKEIERIREIEMSGVRIEEANKYRQQLQKARSEMEQHWKDQLASLKQREKETKERLNLREKELDNKEYSQRQQYLKDLEALKQKEADMKRAVEIEMEAARVQRQSWESKKAEVDNKLKELGDTKKKLETKAESDFLHYKQDYQRQHDEEYRKLITEKLEIESLKKTLEFEASKYQESHTKLENTSKELQTCKQHLEKLQEENQSLSKQLLQTQEELKVVSETSRRNLDLLSLKDQELQTSKQECQTYKSLFEEQRDNCKQIEQQQKQVVEQLSLEVKGLQMYGKNYFPTEESEYLSNRKSALKELEKETNNLKKNVVDFYRAPSMKHSKDPFASIKVPKREKVIPPNYYSPKATYSTERHSVQLNETFKPTEEAKEEPSQISEPSIKMPSAEHSEEETKQETKQETKPEVQPNTEVLYQERNQAKQQFQMNFELEEASEHSDNETESVDSSFF